MTQLRVSFENLYVFEDEEAGDTRIGLYGTVTGTDGVELGSFRWNHRNGPVEDNFDYPLDGDPALPSVLQFDLNGTARVSVKAYTDNDVQWPDEGHHENFLGEAEVLIDNRDPATLGRLLIGPTTTDNGHPGIVVTANAQAVPPAQRSHVRLVWKDLVLINDENSDFTHMALYIRAQGHTDPTDRELLRWNNNGDRVYDEALFPLSYGTPTTVFDLVMDGPTRFFMEAYSHDDDLWPSAERYENFLGRAMFVIDPAEPATLGSLLLGPTQTDQTHPGYLVTLSAEVLPPDATPDLQITGVEVTQAVQAFHSPVAPDNAVPLVAGRTTLVRVYLDSGVSPEEGGGLVTGVTGTLDLNNGTYTATPLAPITARPADAVQRTELGHTLNFRIPADRLVPGKARILVQASVTGSVSNPVELLLDVFAAHTLDILMVRVETDTVPAPGDAEYITAVNRLTQVYPIAEDPAKSIRYWLLPGNEVIHTSRDLGTLEGMKHFLNDLEDVQEESADYKKLYALVDRRAHMERVGDSRREENVAFGYSDLTSSVAHELGHVYGLDHAPCGPQNDKPGNTDANYRPPDGSIGDVGVDPVRLDVYPATVPDLMSYCRASGATTPYDQWIGVHHWSRLRLFLAEHAAERAARTPRPPLELAATTVPTSVPFPGPFVRVRGSLSASGTVSWSPALRTATEPASARAASAQGYEVSFESATGEILARAATEPRFQSATQPEATFTARLPYHEHTRRIVLRLNGTEVGALRVPPAPPRFALLAPAAHPQIDTEGILHLRWQQVGGDTETDPPATFFVRFSHADGGIVLRPGVGLTGDSYDLDLRALPGHRRCFVQVIATNGYHTSYVQTPPFPLPLRPPRFLPANSDGPLLHVQGHSPQHGPLTGPALTWQVDGSPASVTGGSLEVRSLGPGTHRLEVTATDPDGLTVTQQLGRYDGTTGLRVSPGPGL
ncbi:hypothetical protein [Streptomyces echinatus]|uniref:hypothetical protein n=1 Tax=Streptomyces echinatus TaxID=67293 RepID=UPI00381423F1